MPSEKVKLHLGCGNDIRGGYINIDKYDSAADVVADICDLPYEDNSVDEMLAFQVIEHLPYWQTGNFKHSTDQFFLEAYRVLKPGGFMITECPDAEYAARRIVETGDVDYTSMISLYGEYYRPWDVDRFPDALHHAGALHINAFTYKRCQGIAERVGFTVTREGIEEMDKRYKYVENMRVRWAKPL